MALAAEQTPIEIPVLQIADIELPSEMERLRDLAYDLWWSWSPLATRLFAWIDPEHWRRYHNPVQLLINIEPQQWMRLLSDPEFRRTYEHVILALDEYRARPRWFDQDGRLLPGPVAYFSMEFGIHESLGVYSGGLGVLAGDHCKAASDLGVPLIGIGLYYQGGDFDQQIGLDGWQRDSDDPIDPTVNPVVRVNAPGGGPRLVPLTISGHDAQIAHTSLVALPTPGSAGHAVFTPDHVEQVTGPVWNTRGIAGDQFMGLGNPALTDPRYEMTVLSLRLAGRVNGVSARHREES